MALGVYNNVVLKADLYKMTNPKVIKSLIIHFFEVGALIAPKSKPR